MRHSNTTWTPQMIDALVTRYPHELTADIARDFGMNKKKLYAKASHLGLKKTPEYMATPKKWP